MITCRGFLISSFRDCKLFKIMLNLHQSGWDTTLFDVDNRPFFIPLIN